MYQSQDLSSRRATMDPVASFSAISYPVDIVSRRKKNRSCEAWQPGAKYPVEWIAKERKTRRCVTKIYSDATQRRVKSGQLRRRNESQLLDAINAQDEKNQWLK
ncbi:hypothetical protein F511_47613 [Dorcoceras hygrometricum]|uniref:Uncharacterized protein n=1 Tax=Dorcoceras hygrometricum TaxID=472368 RepID=A0A2Z6ZQN0_9LAMI|nr:hypothetical protein F511_47613 [Dorcoceras hygrometricum]